MNGRRSFLALVGSVPLIGPLVSGRGYSKPTLVLPTAAPLIVPEGDVVDVAKHPLLAAHNTQMQAMIAVRRDLPDPLFHDWLEGGLRMARSCQPGGQLHRLLREEIAAGRDPWGDA